MRRPVGRVAATREGAEVVKRDPLKPSHSLLCKLGSIAVHAEEAISPKGHSLDVSVLRSLLADPEVKQWIKDMGVYLPVKR